MESTILKTRHKAFFLKKTYPNKITFIRPTLESRFLNANIKGQTEL